MNNNSVNHGRLVRNVLRLMDNAFAQSLYEVLPRGVGVWIPDQSWSIYPDAMVVGGQPLLYSGLTDKVMNPCLLFEVVGDRVAAEAEARMSDPLIEGGVVAKLLSSVMGAGVRLAEPETKGDPTVEPAPDSPAQVDPAGDSGGDSTDDPAPDPATPDASTVAPDPTATMEIEAAIDANPSVQAPSDPQGESQPEVAGSPDLATDPDDSVGDFPPLPSAGVQSFDPHQPPTDSFAYARLIPYLQEYVRISRHRLYIEQYHRVGEHDWELTLYTNADSVIELNVTNARLPLSDIYRQVDFSLLL